MASILGDLCDLTVPELYLADPGNVNEPVGYVQCSEMGSTCETRDCDCRNATSGMVDGSTMYFAVCVKLEDGASCISTGTEFEDCSSSGTGSDSLPGSVTTDSSGDGDSGQTSATSDSASSADKSAGPIDTSKLTTTSSSSPISTPVLVAIIVACVVLVALVSCFARRRCARKATKKNKMSTRRSLSTHGPTEYTETMPSFPAFCRNGRGTRSLSSRSGDSRGKGPHGQNTGRDQRATKLQPGVNGVRRHEGYEEQESTAGYEDMDNYQGDNIARAYAERHQRAMQAAGWGAPNRSRPTAPLPPQRPSARQTYEAPISPGGTVYENRNTVENIMLLTRLAASEGRQHPHYGPVERTGSINNYPVVTARQGSTSTSAFHMEGDPLPLRYSELSPRTTRSVAPSVASSATTVFVADRRRPTPNRREARHDLSSVRSETAYCEDNNDDESRTDTSFSSNALDTTWISTSRLVDGGDYQNNSGPTPSVGDFSDWGASTQNSNDNDRYRSTGASSESFFSSESDSSEEDIYHYSDVHEL